MSKDASGKSRSNTVFQTNTNSFFVGQHTDLPEISLNHAPASSKMQKCEIPKNVMVYCKKFDDRVIESFEKVFQHVSETYEHVFLYTDDWVIEKL